MRRGSGRPRNAGRAQPSLEAQQAPAARPGLPALLLEYLRILLHLRVEPQLLQILACFQIALLVRILAPACSLQLRIGGGIRARIRHGKQRSTAGAQGESTKNGMLRARLRARESLLANLRGNRRIVAPREVRRLRRDTEVAHDLIE